MRIPDIVVINKQLAVILIDIAVPADKRISAKEEEKLMEYQFLQIELENYGRKKQKMVSIVIGALGSFSKHLNVFCGLELLDLDTLNFYLLQRNSASS